MLSAFLHLSFWHSGVVRSKRVNRASIYQSPISPSIYAKGGTRTHTPLRRADFKSFNSVRLLNKLPVSTLVELSNFSKSYISQVKHGKRPPSQNFLNALQKLDKRGNDNSINIQNAILMFLESRREGLSPRTIDDFYRKYLSKAVPALGLTPTHKAVSSFINSLSCSLGGNAASRCHAIYFGHQALR